VEGGYTLYQGEQMAIYDAAMKHIADGTPTVIFAGEEYGTGSSRDWAAKGTQLLGVKAVIAKSYERIHRSNLVGMGVRPFSVQGQRLAGYTQPQRRTRPSTLLASTTTSSRSRDVQLSITRRTASSQSVALLLRIRHQVHTIEVDYYKNGGILPFVLKGD